MVEQGVCQKMVLEKSSIHSMVIPKPTSFEISVNTSMKIEESQLRRREKKTSKCGWNKGAEVEGEFLGRKEKISA